MADGERLVVSLEARVSDFERQMRRAEQRGTRTYQGLRRNSRSATQQMEQDMVRSTARINQALASTSSKIGIFGTAFAGGLFGGFAAGFVGNFKRSMDSVVKEVASIADVADRVQIGIEALQGLQHGFQLAGFSTDEFNAALTRFTRRVGEAVNGGGPLQTTLERYGISVRRVNGEMKTQMEMLREVAEVIRKAGTDQEKLAIAQAAFGDVGRRMVNALKGGADGIDNMIDAARDAGVVLDEELVRKAEEIDRKFAELSARAAAFSRRLVVGLVAAGAEMTDLRERLDLIFASEGEGRAILGDELYDSLAANRDMVDENAEALHRLDERYAALAEEADAAGFAMRSAIGLLDSWGYDQVADSLRIMAQELDTVAQGFRDGGTTAEDFATRLTEIQKKATDAFDALEAGDRVRFEGVIGQLSRLGGVIASVTSLADSLTGALARAAGVDASSKATQALRDRHAAEAASMDSLERLTAANDKFAASEAARNAASSDQLKLQREIEATRKRMAEAGATFTEAEIERAARAALAADAARQAADKGARGGAGSGSSRGGGRASLDDYAREAQAIRERTAALEVEAVVLIAVAESGEEYGDALEFARKKAELLHAAQRAGKQITPELTAEVDKLAQAYVNAGLEAEAAAEKMERIQEQSERGKNALANMFGAIFDGSKSARQAIADLLMEMAKVQFINGMMSLPGMGALSGVVGGLLTPTFAAGGMHQGGLRIVGERGPELEATGPARIWTADQTRNMLAGPAQAVSQRGGTSVLKVELSPDLMASLLDAAEGQAIEISKQAVGRGMAEFDRALPARIREVNANWRRR